MALSPPGRFSITTDWLSCSSSAAPSRRAVGSAEPPGGKPTMKRLGFAGYARAQPGNGGGKADEEADRLGRIRLRRDGQCGGQCGNEQRNGEQAAHGSSPASI